MEHLNPHPVREQTRERIEASTVQHPARWQQLSGWDIYHSPVVGGPYSYDETLGCVFPDGVTSLLDYSYEGVVGLELMGPTTLLSQLGCKGAAVELDTYEDYGIDLGGDQVRINCDLRDLAALDYSLDYVKRMFGIDGFGLIIFRPVGGVYNLPQEPDDKLFFWEYIANQLDYNGTAYIQIERTDHKQIQLLQKKLRTIPNVGIFTGKNHSGLYKFDAMRIERYTNDPIDLFSHIY